MINFKKKKPFNVEDMTDEEFSGYIKDAENGKGKLNAEAKVAEEASETEKFSKIKQMAMKLFETENADEALYALIKTAVDAKRGEVKASNEDILRQCEQIKKVYPDFDLSRFLENAEFRKVLEATGNVALAYAKAGEKKARKPRISENGTIPYASSGDVRRSASDMTDEEFKKYIEKIGKKTTI